MFLKDPVLSIMHCALQKIGGYFLDVEQLLLIIIR